MPRSTSHRLVAALLLARLAVTFAFSMRAEAAPARTAPPILVPSSSSSSFDCGCVANPVVLPPAPGCPEWQLYYYGNAGSWNGGRKCFLPTGSSGLAVSDDGLSWTRVPGDEEGGAVLVPSDEEGAWDSVHTGVADVVRVGPEELHMYYFGGSDEAIPMGPGSIVGFRMRIGRARSTDGGRTWAKDEGYVLDYDESEGLFASWPRIVTGQVLDGSGRWRMFYHSFDGQKWRVFGAESDDSGDTWRRTGLVLEGGTSEDDFDYAGIGTRTVTRWRDGLLMIYEGVDKSSTHSLGAAFCADEASNEWKKLHDGSAILEPGKGPLGEWTGQVIGTPYVVTMPDGSLRLYHCAKDGPEGKMAIGVVESKTGDTSAESWSSVEPEPDFVHNIGCVTS